MHRPSLASLAPRRRWAPPGRLLGAVLALACCLDVPVALAQPTVAPGAAGPTATRARIGLVLSGGGARGGAHIGVLKVLEELRVPVDYIAATSAGAIVGAAYASGLPLESLEQEMKQLNTVTLLRDLTRDDLPLRRKADDEVNYIGPEFGIVADGLALPKGAVAGVSLEAVLRRLARRQRSEHFDRLPIPFRAVASDLATGDMITLTHGNLATVMRASMAIPGVVSPVEIDGRLLVDGGLTRNLPVDLVRAMGADVVIAVNIGTPLLKREEITSAFSVSVQMINILTEANVKESLKQLRPDDVLIAPVLDTVSAADFDRLSDAAKVGEDAARAVADRLARFSLTPEAYFAYSAARFEGDRNRPTRIDEIRVTGTARVNPETVVAVMRTRPGDTFEPRRADRDMRRIFGLGEFEGVNYALLDEPGKGGVLAVEVVEKSWGPDYLRFGLGLSSDFEGNAFFNLLATHRRTWINALGGEWRNDVQIGRTDVLRTEWYQPLTSGHRVFVAGRGELVRDPFERYDLAGNRIARFRRISQEVGADIGVPIASAGEARVGLVNGRVRVQGDTGATDAFGAHPDVSTGGVLARIRVDALDNVRFPRSGWALGGEVYSSRESLGAADAYTRWETVMSAAASAGPHALQLGIRAGGGTGSGALPVYEQFTLGGFLQLSGYKTGELLGDEVGLGRAIYTYRLAGPSIFDGAYVGASYEAGRIGDSVFGENRTSLRRSQSLFFAFDTPLGPVYVAYGRAGSGREAAYFFLGRP